MADEDVTSAPAKVSTLRDGLLSIGGGVALAGWNLFSNGDDGFRQPATWARVLILMAAAGLATAVWARWVRGREISGARHFLLTFGVTVGLAAAMFIGTALFVIHERSEPIAVTLAPQLGGRDKVRLSQDERDAVEMGLLMRGEFLDGEDYDVDFALYEGRRKHRDDFVVVMAFSAEPGTPRADGLADNFDDDITAEFLTSATDVDPQSRSLEGWPGQLRCGTVANGGEVATLCAYAYGVRTVLVVMPRQEPEPHRLATAMLADMLRA